MNLNFSISAATSITNKILVIIYKASAPNVEVAHREYNPPHNTEQRVTFPDLEPVSYILNIYETTGYPTLGTLRFSDNIDPTFLGVSIKLTDLITMTGGGTSYTDATWVGWAIDTIERKPQGTMYPGSDYNLKVGGDGFDLAQPGDAFGTNEQWIVRFRPQIVTATPIYNSAKVINSSRVITADTTIVAGDANVAQLMRGAGLAFTATLPLVADLDPFQTFVFMSCGGNHINASVQASGSDRFLWNIFAAVSAPSVIHLGQSENLIITNDPVNGWLVLPGSSEAPLRVGMVIDDILMGNNSFGYTQKRLNTIFADGCNPTGGGTLLARNVYRRLWAAVQASGLAIAEGTAINEWGYVGIDPLTGKASNNKGNYSVGDGTNTFRVPLYYSTGYLRAVSGASRLPGSYQIGDVAPHDHVMHGKGTFTGDSGALFLNRTDNTRYSGGGGDSFGGQLTVDTTLRTGTSDASSLVPSVETTPPNFGIYKSILI